MYVIIKDRHLIVDIMFKINLTMKSLYFIHSAIFTGTYYDASHHAGHRCCKDDCT